MQSLKGLAVSAGPPDVLAEHVVARIGVDLGDVGVGYDVILAVRAPERELAGVEEPVDILALSFQATDVGIGLDGLAVGAPQTDVLLEHGLLERIGVEQGSDLAVEVSVGVSCGKGIAVKRLNTTVCIHGRGVEGTVHIHLEVGESSFYGLLEDILGLVGPAEPYENLGLDEEKLMIAEEAIPSF